MVTDDGGDEGSDVCLRGELGGDRVSTGNGLDDCGVLARGVPETAGAQGHAEPQPGDPGVQPGDDSGSRRLTRQARDQVVDFVAQPEAVDRVGAVRGGSQTVAGGAQAPAFILGRPHRRACGEKAVQRQPALQDFDRFADRDHPDPGVAAAHAVDQPLGRQFVQSLPDTVARDAQSRGDFLGDDPLSRREVSGHDRPAEGVPDVGGARSSASRSDVHRHLHRDC
ncbi:hypothetical protein L2C96_32605 [Amycolatopsis tucumanensis]|uniref:Uncharacterized protein n=1 Tax=Amycolatopsis tucumanensis TaxID=401106 RepID=A0ABP7HMU5_9PSEU|nr:MULTISPECIES: hypothetical protein [Amycolatopsis]MCF6427016.1 hypothetical protein [Amycolatopsis tucumanensis]